MPDLNTGGDLGSSQDIFELQAASRIKRPCQSPLSFAVSVRVSSVKACGPSEGVHQLKVTVLKVILHVIPEIHCGEEEDLDVRFKPEPPQPNTLLGHGKAWPLDAPGASYQQYSRGTAGHGGTTELAGTASRRPALCSEGPVPGCNWGTGSGLEPRGPVGSRVPRDTAAA